MRLSLCGFIGCRSFESKSDGRFERGMSASTNSPHSGVHRHLLGNSMTLLAGNGATQYDMELKRLTTHVNDLH